MGRVTINDIARISGYSKTSVSFAFNDPGRISEKARSKIITVAQELGYIPDPVARNLSLRRHGSIGLLLPEVIPLAFLNPHLSQIVQGIGEVCERHGNSLTLIPPLRESVLEGIRSAAVDGLITIGLEPGMETVELIRLRHMPFVTIDGRIGGGFPVVGIDDFGAAKTIMRYVLSLGHRAIAVIAFTDEPQLETRSHVKTQRIAGYRAAFDEVGRTFTAETTFIEVESSMDGGREAARQILSDHTVPGRKPTAIVAMSDVLAIGALNYAEEAGMGVPKDISIVGFDDIPEARLVRPQLTTVTQPGFLKGQRAAEVLTDLITNVSVESEYILPATIVERDSAAPPTLLRNPKA